MAWRLGQTQSAYGILALLAEGPASGYDIKKILSSQGFFFWNESYGNIYPILRKLLEDGLVRVAETGTCGRRRVPYELTGAGWHELGAWVSAPPNLTRFRVELLMKMRFGAFAGPSCMKRNVLHYRKLAVGEIAETEEALAELGTARADLGIEAQKMALQYFLLFKEAIVRWCDDCTTRLEQLEKEESST